MDDRELNRVVFHSNTDMANGAQLIKAEKILKSNIQDNLKNINDILELYNIKKYFDNGIFLKSWSTEDKLYFNNKANDYAKIIGKFFGKVDEFNFKKLVNEVNNSYINSFWEKFDSHKVFNKIPSEVFKEVLQEKPYFIHSILKNKNTVNAFSKVIRELLLNYSNSAEILLSNYEIKNDFNKNSIFLPTNLTVDDKEKILNNYLESENVNIKYTELILNMRNQKEFKISDKTRLKAKRLLSTETEYLFKHSAPMSFGVTVAFEDNPSEIKKVWIDEQQTTHYIYSADYIRSNHNPYRLFLNFKHLFEYLDFENRINLVSKKVNIGTLEYALSTWSKSEYLIGMAFRATELSSLAQIVSYSKLVDSLGTTLESILSIVFTETFPSIYSFPENAHFSIPTSDSYLEKIRFLAPEFESALKQYRLFVENKHIDLELLQISSTPLSIENIPSLNSNKYLYLNKENRIITNCLNLLFSDQTLLAYVDPFKDKKYGTFFNLLHNEDVKLSYYDEYLQPRVNYLIENEIININEEGLIIFNNKVRVLILKDLHDNEVASFYHYPENYQNEALEMLKDKQIYFEGTLFSKPEKSYFNYYLNKSEFTNGLDLRNSYLHGTQPTSNDSSEHENAYFIYLKLVFLAFLKIDDDLNIYHSVEY